MSFLDVANATLSDPALLRELESLNTSETTMIAAFNQMADRFKERGYNETDFNDFVQTYLIYKYSEKDRFVIENIIKLCLQHHFPFREYVKAGILKTFENTSPTSQKIRDIMLYYKKLGIEGEIKKGGGHYCRRASSRAWTSRGKTCRVNTCKNKKRVRQNRRPSRRTTRSRIRNK